MADQNVLPDSTAPSDPPVAGPAKGPKRHIIRNVMLVVLVLIGGLLGFAATKPDDFQVTRSITIAAPPAAVFPHVNDFRKWEDWSPWAKLDPEAKNSFEGPESGAGAEFSWSGNNDVGEGKMTIAESQPPERIAIKLEFIRPFEDTCDVDFSFQPEGEQTKVTWTMAGQNNFISKIVCLFMNMDQMIGKDFEKGLASMKSVVEADSQN